MPDKNMNRLTEKGCRKLVDFLCSAFTPGEFVVIIRYYYRKMEKHLPLQPDSTEDFFSRLVEAFNRRGLIDSRFFKRLLRKRRKRLRDIDDAALHCFLSNPQSQLSRLPDPQVSIALRHGLFDSVVAILSDCGSSPRLVNLHGARGMGKRLLALRIGEHFVPKAPDFPDRFRAFVTVACDDLSPDPNGTLLKVLGEIRHVSGDQTTRDSPLDEQRRSAVHWLASMPALLVVSLLGEPQTSLTGFLGEVACAQGKHRVVVTSEDELSGPTGSLLENSMGIPVGPLDGADAALLVHASVSIDVNVPDDDIARLNNLCGGSPLALVMVLSATAEQGGYLIEDAVSFLRGRRLTVEEMFGAVFATLDESIRIFLFALSLFPAAALRERVERVAGVSLEKIRPLMGHRRSTFFYKDSTPSAETMELDPTIRNMLRDALESEAALRDSLLLRYVTYHEKLIGAVLPLKDKPNPYYVGLTFLDALRARFDDVGDLVCAVEYALDLRLWRTVRNLSLWILHLLWEAGKADDRLRVISYALDALDVMEDEIAESDEKRLENVAYLRAMLHADGLSFVHLMRQEYEEARHEIRIGLEFAKGMEPVRLFADYRLAYLCLREAHVAMVDAENLGTWARFREAEGESIEATARWDESSSRRDFARTKQDEAESILNRVIESDGAPRGALGVLAVLCLSQKRWSEAEKYTRRLAQQAICSPQSLRYQARAFGLMGHIKLLQGDDPDGAERDLIAARSILEHTRDIRNLMAVQLGLSRVHLLRARLMLEQVATVSRALGDLGHHQEAERMAEKVAELHVAPTLIEY